MVRCTLELVRYDLRHNDPAGQREFECQSLGEVKNNEEDI